MLLSFRFLTDVANVNSFEVVPSVDVNAGAAQDLYLQLIDSSLDRPEQGYSPAGRRYIPAAGATLVVTFNNIDTGPTVFADAQSGQRLNPSVPSQVVRTASQPFTDPSIWKVSLLGSDPLKGTVQMKLVLTETTPARTLTVTPTGMWLRVR